MTSQLNDECVATILPEDREPAESVPVGIDSADGLEPDEPNVVRGYD